MINQIPITKESERMILETFSEYKEATRIPSILRGRTVIHLYPVKDTMNKKGEADGYIDSLFFRFDIYNEQKVYRKKGLYDELVIEVPQRIRYFKDSSTMIVIDEDICIGGVQSILIYPAQS